MNTQTSKSDGASVRYRHTQLGYVTGGAGLFGLLITYGGFVDSVSEWDSAGYAALGGFGLLTALFASLTTEVTDRTFRFYFGPGFWTHTYALDAIRSVDVVRNPIWYGWGIRYTPSGWLYNVSGRSAVEVDLGSEGVIRVGTDEPQQLARALRQAVEAA